MSRTAGHNSPLAVAWDEESFRVARSDGSHVWDERGRKYVDFTSGWCVANLGWGRRGPRDAIRRFRGPSYVDPEREYARWQVLARRLLDPAPRRVAKCVRATGVTGEMEDALHAAQLATGRRAFLSIEGAYHGNTLGALSLGSSEQREKLPNLLPHCDKIEPPLDAAALARVERRLKRRDVAAFVMEPIVLHLAVLHPAVEFMEGLQRLCREHGTLLVLDEVATGFGRTGRRFASEHFDLEPDVLCLAKAMSGGAAGIGAMLATARVARAMEREGEFHSTYGWHPLAVEAAIAHLDDYVANERRLLAHVAAMSLHFAERLAAIEFKRRHTVRVHGMAIAVDLGGEAYATQIEADCEEAGLLISTQEGSLVLLPPLNAEKAVARRGLDLLERCA